jgi:uncharacterized protein (TIGR01244 family)
LSGWSPKYFPKQVIQYANTQLKHKMLFGSDFPLIHPDKWMAAAAEVGFRDEVMPGIMKDNAARVLGWPEGGGVNADPVDIRNFLRLSPGVTTSGRLQPGDPARLAAMGARRVINLALDSHAEALPDAAAEMAAAGLGYAHIPVPFDTPGEAHYRAFVAALEADDTPVHVHCIMNWRVSAFFCRYHLERGMDESAARALLDLVWNPESSDYPGADKWAAMALLQPRGERP